MLCSGLIGADLSSIRLSSSAAGAPQDAHSSTPRNMNPRLTAIESTWRSITVPQPSQWMMVMSSILSRERTPLWGGTQAGEVEGVGAPFPPGRARSALLCASSLTAGVRPLTWQV